MPHVFVLQYNISTRQFIWSHRAWVISAELLIGTIRPFDSRFSRSKWKRTITHAETPRRFFILGTSFLHYRRALSRERRRSANDCWTSKKAQLRSFPFLPCRTTILRNISSSPPYETLNFYPRRGSESKKRAKSHGMRIIKMYLPCALKWAMLTAAFRN